MLVISRKAGEALVVGNVTIHVNEVRNDTARLAFDAPKDVKILRKELVDADKEREAAEQS